MRKLVALAGFILTIGAGAFGVAQAAMVQPYQQAAFDAAQKSDKPILVFVEASWCPTCAKERPILQRLYETPEFTQLQVFDVDFDKNKPLLRQLGVQMQSTLIVYLSVSILTGVDRSVETTLVEASPAWLTNLTTIF